MDRTGLVGADGPTHCGSFDVTYMACLPNMVVMAPSDEAELFIWLPLLLPLMTGPVVCDIQGETVLELNYHLH